MQDLFGPLHVVLGFLGLPITTDNSAFYFFKGAVGVGLAFALAAYGFYTSLDGKPVFGSALLDVKR